MIRRRSTGFWASLAQLSTFVKGRRKREFFTIVFLTVVGAVSEIVTIGAVVPFLALLAGGPLSGRLGWIHRIVGTVAAKTNSTELVTATVLLSGGAVASSVLRGLLVRKTQDFTADFGHQLSVEVQRRMLLQPYSWHVLHNSSEQLAAIEKVETLTSSVVLSLLEAVSAAVLVVVIVAVLLEITPFATVAAAAALGGAYLLLGALVRTRLQIYSETIASAFGDRIRIVQEGLAGIRDIILDGSHGRVMQQFRDVDLRVARVRANGSFVASVPRVFIEPAAIVVIAGLAVFLSQREGGLVAALPVLGAFALGAQRLLPFLQQLYNGWTNVTANAFVIDDVVKQLALPLPPPQSVAGRLPFERLIAFRDVTYNYANRTDPAVDHLSFEIRRGSRVALTGPNGSGKSTTADLLMGLLEPSAGDVLVDGVVLTDLNRQSWRSNVAHVPQMLFVADATIAQNIALGANVDMGRIRQAASLARFDEFIGSLPEGYETRVGERGAQISGGQRQRLAIARAIYRDCPFLVFDEATSALDQVTEASVLRTLDELQLQGRTILMIAHRETTRLQCDHVLRLQEGRLVEDSAPA